MEHDDESGLLGGVGEAEVEVEAEDALVAVFAEENERAFLLPEQNAVGGLSGKLEGLADEQGLPVDAVHQWMRLGKNAALEVFPDGGGVFHEKDRVAFR